MNLAGNFSYKRNKRNDPNEKNFSNIINPKYKCNTIYIQNYSNYTVKYTSKPYENNIVTHDEKEAALTIFKATGNAKQVQDIERGDTLEAEIGYIPPKESKSINIGQCTGISISYYYYIHANQPAVPDEQINCFVGGDPVLIKDPIPERENQLKQIRIDLFNKTIEVLEKQRKDKEDHTNECQQDMATKLAGIQENITKADKKKLELIENIQRLTNDYNEVSVKLDGLNREHISLTSTNEREKETENIELNGLNTMIEQYKNSRNNLQSSIFMNSL